MSKNTNYTYGAIPSPMDLRNYRISTVARAIELPDAFEVPHSKIKNQGPVGSCVAHGISEVLELADGNNYSTGWIYGYRPDGYYQGHGMVISQALKTVKNVGYMLNSDLNVNVEMTEAKEIVDNNLDVYKAKASERKIGSYARLYNLREIKEAIYCSGKPVLVAFDVDIDGLQLDDNYIAYVPLSGMYSGGHLTVCYGWNETGLLIQNSWGSSWGNKGTFILPYAYPFYEAWMIKFEPDEEEPVVPTPTPDIDIVKPDLYWLRKLIMIIVKFFRNLK